MKKTVGLRKGDVKQEDIVKLGDKVMTDVTNWLLAYRPEPMTRAACNRMRYFALLAYETVDNVQTAVSVGSVDGISVAREKFFAKTRELAKV